jgi:RNA polymerase-binding transcription factor DksA
MDEPLPLSNDELRTLRALLRSEQASTRRRLAGLERTFDELVAAADLEPPDDEHDPDGTTAFERAQVTSLAAEARSHLADLDRAMVAIDGGRYGWCVSCSRPIGAARLGSVPATVECVVCASGLRAER